MHQIINQNKYRSQQTESVTERQDGRLKTNKKQNPHYKNQQPTNKINKRLHPTKAAEALD